MNRRGFLIGAGCAVLAAPAIVRASSLMPVRVPKVVVPEVVLYTPTGHALDAWARELGFVRHVLEPDSSLRERMIRVLREVR